MADTLKNAFFHLDDGDSTNLQTITPTATDKVRTILALTICNRSAVGHTIDVRVVDAGGSNTFQIIKGATLPAKSTFEHTDKIILEEDCELQLNLGDSATGSGAQNNFDVVIAMLEQDL